MELIIHRGAKQVGGSCVEVSTPTTRLIIDAGANLNAATPNILPVVPGLFTEGPKIDGILLSHAHGDHSGLIAQARPGIPLLLSRGTDKMLMAGTLFAGQTSVGTRERVFLSSGRVCRLGDIQILPLSVDHSAFDSLAFLIASKGKRILYTGDLRLHGRKPGMARQLIAAARERTIDCLIVEGTNLTREPGMTEKELEERIVDELRRTTGLALAMFSPMHVDRLVTFYKAARRSGRTFVVDAYAAFVLHLVSSQARVPRAQAKNGIRVFFNAAFQRRRNLGKIRRLFTHDRIELEHVIANPARHLMLFRPSMLELDFNGQSPLNALWFYSYWPGYLERDDWKVFLRQIVGTQGKLVPMHTSGHIFRDDLVRLVRAIAPRHVIPIHTNTPELFLDRVDNVRMLKDGEPFQIL